MILEFRNIGLISVQASESDMLRTAALVAKIAAKVWGNSDNRGRQIKDPR